MVEYGGDKAVVAALIEKATNSTMPEVDPRLLKAIKTVVRHSDSELRLAAQTLMSLMKRDHSQVRYLTLLIIDELFMRSKLFRSLLVENLDQLLTLSVGFRKNLPLPAPAAVASVMRSKAIEFLEKWNASFGIHYRHLRLGYDYLKNTLRYQFPNLQANAARLQQERRERDIRTKEILLNKFESLKMNLASIRSDIQSTTDEISQCLDIIQIKEDDMPWDPVVDDEEMVEFRNTDLRQIRLDSLKEGEKVQENSENKVIFDTLRELYKVLVTKHLVTVQEWISVLIRVEVAENTFRNNMLKEFIDLQNHLRAVKMKCEEFGCYLSKTTNVEEEDIWEEGTIESFSQGVPVMTKNSSELHGKSTSMNLKDETSDCSHTEIHGSKKLVPESCGAESDTVRSQLLVEAPVMKWGVCLDNWGSKQDVLANQRGLDLEGHWGRVDYDAVIPAAKIAELSVQSTIYKEEPVEILPCRAPLRKGGHCQRRDLRTCPFHGPIVPRDDEGKPLNPITSMEDIPHDLGSENSLMELLAPDVAEQLAEQAVKNVRERDKEGFKKREMDKKALKRAKLAKVREHNESVLRDAALASTSRSSYIGEDVETTNEGRSSARNKRETLASMLKKKVTVKDRLSQKLLNTRAKDATVRQLTVEEDATYKEAFSNQW